MNKQKKKGMIIFKKGKKINADNFFNGVARCGLDWRVFCQFKL